MVRQASAPGPPCQFNRHPAAAAAPRVARCMTEYPPPRGLIPAAPAHPDDGDACPLSTSRSSASA